MPQRSKVAFRNKSHSGWWIFNEVEQWVSKRQKRLSPGSRCLVWENTRLIRAKNRDEASPEKNTRLESLGARRSGDRRYARSLTRFGSARTLRLD